MREKKVVSYYLSGLVFSKLLIFALFYRGLITVPPNFKKILLIGAFIFFYVKQVRITKVFICWD